MKLLFLLTVVLELSLNSPPRATRRRRVPPSRRQVRHRLQRLRSRQLPPVLVALFAASTLQWTTRKPRIQPSQSTKRVQLFHPVQNLPTATAPSAGCKRTRIRSDFPHIPPYLMPRERISTTSRNRSWRTKVRRGSRRQRSSATGSLCITRISRERFRSPTSTLGSMRAGTTTITRRTTRSTCAGSAAFTTCYMHTKSSAGPLRNKWPGAPGPAAA